MTGYRAAGSDEGTTVVKLPRIRRYEGGLQQAVWAFGIVTAGLVLHGGTVRPPYGFVFAFAVLALAVSYLRFPPTTLVIDRLHDRLAIRRWLHETRTIAMSEVEELVTERTRVMARVFLKMRSGEEVLVWSGSSVLAEDVPARVQKLLLEPLEEFRATAGDCR